MPEGGTGAALEHRSSSVTVHSGLPSQTRSGVDGLDGVDDLDGVDYGVVWPLVGVVRTENDGNVSASLTQPLHYVA